MSLKNLFPTYILRGTLMLINLTYFKINAGNKYPDAIT